MATFRVEWKSGKVVEITSSDCTTVEQFINSYFGRGVSVDAKVSIAGEINTPTEVPAPKKKVKKAAA